MELGCDNIDNGGIAAIVLRYLILTKRRNMENEIDTLQDAFERYLEEHSDELEEDSEEE